MSTHATVYIREDNEPLCCLYIHYDGYPEGAGLDIARFLQGEKVVNGISLGSDRHVFNGMGDLAVRLITYLKGDPHRAGNLYLEPADFYPEEFSYHIRVVDDTLLLEAFGPDGPIFSGTPKEFIDTFKAQS